MHRAPRRPNTSGSKRTIRIPAALHSGVHIMPTDVDGNVEPLIENAAFSGLVRELNDSRFSMTSLTNQCAVAYQEMLLLTRSRPFPNPLRTSFSCAVLDRLIGEVVTLSKQYGSGDVGETLLHQVKADIFASLYHGTTPDIYIPSTATSLDKHLGRFKSYSLYFREYEIAALERDSALEELRQKRSTTSKELLLMERIIARWQSMLLDRLFCAWRQFTRRRKVWRERSDISMELRNHRLCLRRAFSSWKAGTVISQLERELNNSVEQCHQHVESEEGLLREYAKLISGIETLKGERGTLQETIRRMGDETAALRSTIDNLQVRLDRQRASTVAWRDLAVSLGNMISAGAQSETVQRRSTIHRGSRASQVTLSPTVPSLGISESSADFAISGRRQASRSFSTTQPSAGLAEGDPLGSATEPTDPVLRWLNGCLAKHHRRMTTRTEQASEENSDSATGPKLVTNFTADFASGELLVDLAVALGALPHIEALYLRKSPSSIRKITQSISSLTTTFEGLREITVDSVDIACSQCPAVLRLFLSCLMSLSPGIRCPLCHAGGGGNEPIDSALPEEQSDTRTAASGIRSNSVFARTDEASVMTIADVTQKVAEAKSYYLKKQAEVQSVIRDSWHDVLKVSMMSSATQSNSNSIHAIIEVAAAEVVSSKTSSNTDDLDMYVDSMSVASRKLFARCCEVFQLWTAGQGASPESCVKQVEILKATFPSRKVCVKVLDSFCDAAGDRIVTSSVYCVWLTYLSALSIVHHNASDHTVHLATRMENRINAYLALIASDSSDSVARLEFENFLTRSSAVDAIKDATVQLTRLWLGANSAATQFAPTHISVDQFVSLITEQTKVVTSGTAKSAPVLLKKVFAFVVPSGDLMSFDQFSRAMVALAVMKDNTPWIPLAQRWKNFSSTDLQPPKKGVSKKDT